MSVDAIGRLGEIERRVATEGRAKISDLADALGVSEMTVRRDLDVLSEEGRVRRVRGGAVANGPQPFAERFAKQSRAKDKIAEKVIGLIGQGGAIGLDASTTLQRVAARMHEVGELTVVTNGPECFNVLQQQPGVTTILLGGQLDRRTGSLVGPLAVRSAHDLFLRRFFVSAAGIDPVMGTSETTLEEAEVKEALALGAEQVVVAVDSTKLDRRAPGRCLNFEKIDLLVTELNPADARLDSYRKVCQVI
ncbi:MAG TPA: DeoR/GlpR family DNA-binding transcription regulator [Acidimicrobiales bacterium]|jgi:DeoR family fructose operon transcriptional repressor|nr:DeoR/GlpR family DNA-binding transcription regulator [Acidimicrobiales bacterium]